MRTHDVNDQSPWLVGSCKRWRPLQHILSFLTIPHVCQRAKLCLPLGELPWNLPGYFHPWYIWLLYKLLMTVIARYISRTLLYHISFVRILERLSVCWFLDFRNFRKIKRVSTFVYITLGRVAFIFFGNISYNQVKTLSTNFKALSTNLNRIANLVVPSEGFMSGFAVNNRSAGTDNCAHVYCCCDSILTCLKQSILFGLWKWSLLRNSCNTLSFSKQWSASETVNKHFTVVCGDNYFDE